MTKTMRTRALQAASFLRQYARDRQKASGRWTLEEQAIVECAISLEEEVHDAVWADA